MSAFAESIAPDQQHTEAQSGELLAVSPKLTANAPSWRQIANMPFASKLTFTTKLNV
jgi:hypothetical protein